MRLPIRVVALALFVAPATGARAVAYDKLGAHFGLRAWIGLLDVELPR